MPAPSLPLDPAGLAALVRRGALQAQRAVDAEVDRIVGLGDPMERLAAHAALVRLLGQDGEALSHAASDRILRTLHQDAAQRERDQLRARYEAEQAAHRRMDRLRPWAAAAIPAVATLPGIFAAAIAGWRPLDVLAAAVEAPWMAGWPLAAMAVLVGGIAVLARWCGVHAGSTDALFNAVAAALVAGGVLVVAASALPVYRTADGVRLSDGADLGRSIVRVEHRWPAEPDLLHVLVGNGRVPRGTLLTLRGDGERYLRAASPPPPAAAPARGASPSATKPPLRRTANQ